jgi:hypothetical protein
VRVCCNLCENGDIQDEKHVIFSCMGTEHLRHQFNCLSDNIFNGDIKCIKFINAAVDLFDWFFVGTYRSSSHARLEAFVG